MGINALRRQLAKPATSIQLCLLGIVGGCCAAGLIIAFRLSYEEIQLLFINQIDDFRSLEDWQRIALPVGGALLIITFASTTGFKHYRMGVPFVIHRIKTYYGKIPFRTTLNQFFGGILALGGGFAVGREGPSVHLGAAGSSFLGQWLRLPSNSIRTLAGCGIAAGISASFNTPFAAVIFVMEVVLREYKIHVFIPVMLAAACGSFLTRLVFGETHELSFIEFVPLSNWIYFYLVPCGMLFGGLATLFNRQLMQIIHWGQAISAPRRILLAGMITGAIGFFLPEAMGAGLAPLDDIFSTNSSIGFLSLILIAKITLTLCALGLGIPGGVIGPVFCIGIISGVLLLAPLEFLSSDAMQYSDSFALLGMAGLLTSVAHAPLAALSAVMELSYSPDVILPAMLVVVPAYVTSTQLLKNQSIFILQLKYQGLSYTLSPIRESLQKVGVLSVLTSEFKLIEETTNQHILNHLEQSDQTPLIVSRQYEIDTHYLLATPNDKNKNGFDLKYIQGISSQATMAEVFEELKHQRSGAVYIYDDAQHNIIGMISWDMLRSYLFNDENS